MMPVAGALFTISRAGQYQTLRGDPTFTVEVCGFLVSRIPG